MHMPIHLELHKRFIFRISCKRSSIRVQKDAFFLKRTDFNLAEYKALKTGRFKIVIVILNKIKKILKLKR